MAVGSSSNPSGSGKESESLEHYGRWSDLHTDILGCIVRRLSGLADRIRFATVCKPWRSACMLQPPSTWSFMVLSPDPSLETRSFFSLSDDSLQTLRIPEADGALFCGSFDDWMVVAHRAHGNFLLNPFSRAKIPLPHQITIPFEDQWIYRKWSDRPDDYRRFLGFIRKAILSSSPSLESEGRSPVVVAAIFDDSHSLCVCRLGGGRWISFAEAGNFDFHDIIFYQGVLYAVSNHGLLYTIEMGNDQITYTMRSEIQHPPRISGERTHLVESCGRLLMVKSNVEYMRDLWCGITTGFKVFELQSGPPPRWVEVKSLGGHAVFLGISCSRSVPASRYMGLKEDCIYFIDGHFHSFAHEMYKQSYPYSDSGVFSMEDGSITPFPPTPSTMSAPLWLHFTFP